jgi:hypothetical protein
MTINGTTKGMQSNSIPGFSSPRSSSSMVAMKQTPENDGVQLTRLGGVLNAFHVNASLSNSRLDRLTPMVRSSRYSVNGVELGRKLMAEMFQKQ